MADNQSTEFLVLRTTRVGDSKIIANGAPSSGRMSFWSMGVEYVVAVLSWLVSLASSDVSGQWAKVEAMRDCRGFSRPRW